MKKIAFIAIAVLLILACICSAASCKKNEENETESGTLEDKSYLSPEELGKEETTAEIIFSDETETESETEKETEKETEAIIIESLRFVSFGNGTCSVSGIGNYKASCVVIPERSPDGDIVTSIEEKAFYGNKDIKAIEIPSTVTSIGSTAFGGCTSLVYISVDKANKAFADIDGILYTKDKKELIAYPAACGASSIELSSSVKKIADMAFYGCDTLKTINYDGTLTEWGQIEIGTMNYGLYTAALSCNDTSK